MDYEKDMPRVKAIAEALKGKKKKKKKTPAQDQKKKKKLDMEDSHEDLKKKNKKGRLFASPSIMIAIGSKKKG